MVCLIVFIIPILHLILQRALDTLKVPEDTQHDVLRVVAAALKLSNLSIAPANNIDGTEGCTIHNEYGMSHGEMHHTQCI